MPVTAHDLADIAADKLDRLASDLAAMRSIHDRLCRAADTHDLSVEANAAERTVQASCNEVVGALDKLEQALPERTAEDKSRHRMLVGQRSLIRSGAVLAPDGVREWATGWRTFAAA